MSDSIDVRISESAPADQQCDALVVFVPEDAKSNSEAFQTLDKHLKNSLSSILRNEQFRAKVGETISFHTQGATACGLVILSGAGKLENINEDIIRRAAASAVQAARKSACSHVSYTLPHTEGKLEEVSLVRAIADGALLGSYRFLKFKTKEEDLEPGKKIKQISILAANNQENNSELKRARIFSDATYLARDLVNEPPNTLHPERLAEIATAIAKEEGLEIRVLEVDELRKLGAGAILGVGSGSRVPPRLIHLTYRCGKKDARKIALVGKGITFDSGGLSLKPSKSMESMKCDMAGAAAVLCAMSKINDIKPNCDVLGILCAAENMPSGSAIRPGDVLHAMNGKSIEIINTDAEGRLVLADGLSWAVKQGAEEIVDLATLTGACVVGLGPFVAGVMGNDPDLIHRVVDSGKRVGESYWELPIPNDYDFMVKSDIADIKNLSTNSEAGAIQGALFLREFIGEARWAHLDIAGPAWLEKEFFYAPKNGTGFGVRTLLQYLSGF